MQIVPKLWGEERWLVNNDLYCAKFLYFNPGYSSSLHFHRLKQETFYVMSGNGWLELNDVKRQLAPGDTTTIFPQQRHRVWVPETHSRPLSILEISTHHDGNDVDRIEHGCHSVINRMPKAGGSNFPFVDGCVRYLRYGLSTWPINLWAISDADRRKLAFVAP